MQIEEEEVIQQNEDNEDQINQNCCEDKGNKEIIAIDCQEQEQKSMKERENKKNISRKINGLDQNNIVETRRERKQPKKQVYEESPMPIKKNPSKPKQQYVPSEVLKQCQEECGNFRDLFYQLKQQGFPTVNVDEQVINKITNAFLEEKEDANKDKLICYLIQIFSESYEETTTEPQQTIKTKILKLVDPSWDDNKWSEKITSFTEVIPQSNISLNSISNFNYTQLFSIIGNPLPPELKDFDNHLVQFTQICQAKQKELLKEFFDLNEILNIRIIRKYIMDLLKKLKIFEDLSLEVSKINKQDKEEPFIQKLNKAKEEYMTVKNQILKLKQKRQPKEVKVKEPKEPKQPKEQKQQKVKEQQKKNQMDKQEEINETYEQQSNSKDQQDTEKKGSQTKVVQKLEKQEQKKEKIIQKNRLDNYKFKKVEQIPLVDKPKTPLATQERQQEITIDEQQIESNKIIVEEVPIIQKQIKPISSYFQKIDKPPKPQCTVVQPQLKQNQEFQKDSNRERFLEEVTRLDKRTITIDEYNEQEIPLTKEIVQPRKPYRRIFISISDSTKEFKGKFLNKSKKIKGRKPFILDEEVINYEQDSEEELAEIFADNISQSRQSEESDQSSDMDEQDVKFVVDDGHLSQSELDDNEFPFKNVFQRSSDVQDAYKLTQEHEDVIKLGMIVIPQNQIPLAIKTCKKVKQAKVKKERVQKQSKNQSVLSDFKGQQLQQQQQYQQQQQQQQQ